MQPGESGRMSFVIKTGRMSGPLAKTIQIHTNVPGPGGTTQITMKGECWLSVEVTPRSANFGRLSPEQTGQGTTMKLTVVNNLVEPTSLTDVRSTNPAFKAEVTPLEPGKKWDVVVSLVSTPEAPLRRGNIAGTIEIATGVADLPTLQIPVSASIPADVDVQPENVQLPGNRTADTQRMLTVRNYTTTPLQISDLTATSPDLRLTLQELEAGMSYRINVDIPATYQAAPAGDKITFKTTCPSTPEITVLVTEFKTAMPMPTAAPGAATTAARPGVAPSVTPVPIKTLAPAGPAPSPGGSPQPDTGARQPPPPPPAPSAEPKPE